MTNSIKFLSSSKQHKWIKSYAGVGFKEDLKGFSYKIESTILYK